MTITVSRALIGAAAAAVVMALSGRGLLHGAGSSCGMQLNNAAVAFCETFDNPFPVTNRSGQLNGTLWGLSRITGAVNAGQGQFDDWALGTIDACGGSQPAQPDATDVIVCNGQLREVNNDNVSGAFEAGTVTTLAMYPKQPFDFAGRTGVVAFDVTNDTSGTHGYWPELWISDQPVPAPFTHGGPPCDLCSVPRNGLGIRFAANQGDCPGGWRADSAVVVRNYVAEDHGIFDADTGGMLIRETGCASLSGGPNGSLNHVEVVISQNQIDVYASNADTTALNHINTITNANLSFTRGVVWIEDVHYNADKAGAPHNHTFTWDNVAFDGPVVNRDLSFDVLDSLVPSSDGGLSLGWHTNSSTPVSLNTLPMTSANIAAAAGSLLLFNFDADGTQVSTFNYTINGVPNSAPLPAPLPGWRSAALPISLSNLVPGAQSIVLSADQGMVVANVNIVLAGAGGGGVAGGAPSAPVNLQIQ